MSNITLANDKLVFNGDFKSTKEGLLLTSTKEQKEYHIKITNSNKEDLYLVIDKNSDVKIIIELLSNKGEKQLNKINIEVLENANLTFLSIVETNQEESKLELSFNVGKNANVDVLTSYLAKNITSNQDVILSGTNANINLKSVVLSSTNNNQEINTHITHRAKNSFADMTKIGIVNSNGRIVLNGIAKIDKSYNDSSAFQSLKGITTSDDAYIEVNPILLIDEYDVKAGHGATVGKVEDETLYYLMSRGLTKEEAEKLVLLGFLNPISLEIKDEDVKNRFMDLVEKRL